jgi:digalactosyldiacylglycerol synthase
MRKHTDLITPLTSAVALNGLESRIRDVQVTGVLAAFAQVPPVEAATRGVYFLGRLVWDKGFATLIEVSKRMDLAIDVFGDGPDAAAIKEEAKRRGAPLRFLGPTDSPWERLRDYRVFFNPSLSEVLCTATAESLVAGRHAVMPDCLGNRPFFAYPNAHAYHDLDGAVAALEHALTAPPEPPSAVRHDFDWTTACRTLAALF